MILHLQTHTSKTIIVQLIRNSTIFELRRLIELQEGLPSESFRLLFSEELPIDDDTRTFESYNITTLPIKLVPRGFVKVKLQELTGRITMIDSDLSELVE